MDRLNAILEQAKKQRQEASSAAAPQAAKAAPAMPLQSKMMNFMRHNKVPRLIIYAFIMAKVTLMYDKIRQLVAINNIYTQLLVEQS